MKISVIIPAINEATMIGVAVDRAWSAGADQVLVVDGGSDDATIAICKTLNCTLVQSAAGRGPQLNAGARAATGEVLVFVHADNWLATDAIDALRDLAQTKPDIFGGFKQIIESDSWIFRWIEMGNAARVRWRGLVYGDQAMFVTKSIFDAVGGFASIPLMEDLDFSRRVKKKVWPLVISGPTYISPRRWQTHGPVRQTIRNWYLATSFLLGGSPERLAEKYRRHDRQ